MIIIGQKAFDMCIMKKNMRKIIKYLNSSQGQKELTDSYEETKKVVDELKRSRIVDNETLYSPFDV